MTEEIAEKKRMVKSIWKGILIRVGTFALTLWIVFTFVFGIRIADGNDMAPAIREGDLLVYYRCGNFANRDSVVCETPAGDLKAGVTVEPGRFFILGDCREESTDSRCFGTVGKDQIRGKVFLLWRRRNI